jgi:hypothetical protein
MGVKSTSTSSAALLHVAEIIQDDDLEGVEGEE